MGNYRKKWPGETEYIKLTAEEIREETVEKKNGKRMITGILLPC